MNLAAPRSVWRNWISLAGMVLAGASLFAFLVLVGFDLMGRTAANPYLGILCYVVTPAFLIVGLAAAFLGAWQQRRHDRRVGQAAPAHALSIDLSRQRDRRLLIGFGAGASLFLVLTALGSYQTYVYSESNQFCGEVCHAVMGPEYSAYHRTAHANVACVECHIGSGATWFLKAKLNGTRQLWGVISGKYSRPIPTPIANLRPARETCETCHWPGRNAGGVEREFNRYLADDKNTPYATKLVVNVGGGEGGHGPAGGIHWHMNLQNRVDYFASDAKRQVIPWVRITDGAGRSTVYRTADFKGEPPLAQIRRMDCLDCHNRPAHRYETPNDAVDAAMYAGRIDPSLKAVKRTAVALLTKGYATQSQALNAVATGIHAAYGTSPAADRAATAVQEIYRDNIFPEMKADWSQYPDNLGHLDSAGCFRCHDGKHAAVGDSHRMPATDCNSCHVLLAQGSGAQLAQVAPGGVTFKHPSSNIDGMGLLCSDCHNGKKQED